MKDTYTAEEFNQLLKSKKIRVEKNKFVMDEKTITIPPKKTTKSIKLNKSYNTRLLKIELELEERLPTLNKYINIERGNRYKAANAKKKYTDMISKHCKQYRGVIDPSGLYDVSTLFIMPDNREDSDNVFFTIKYILDGIIDAGILEGDGRRNIRNIHHNIKTVKGEYKIEITLIKV